MLPFVLWLVGKERGNRFQMDALLRVACLLAAAVLPHAPLEGCRYTPTALWLPDAGMCRPTDRENGTTTPEAPQHLVEKQTQESLRRMFLAQTTSSPEYFYGSAIFYGTIWMACHQDANNQPLERVRLFQVGWLLTALRCCMLELQTAWHLVQIKTPPADKHALTQHLDPALGSSWDHGVSRVSNIYILLGVSESETSNWVQPTREQISIRPASHWRTRLSQQGLAEVCS